MLNYPRNFRSLLFLCKQEADKVLSSTLFKHEQLLHNIWVNYPPHPIQEQEPQGDRKWINAFPLLMVSWFNSFISFERLNIKIKIAWLSMVLLR